MKTTGIKGDKGGQRGTKAALLPNKNLSDVAAHLPVDYPAGQRVRGGARGRARVCLLLCVAQLDVHVGVSRVQAASEQCMRQHAAISLASKRVEGGGGCTLVLRPCRRQYHLVHAGRAAVLFRPGSKSPNDAYCANDTVGWVSAATATAKEHARACCR